MTFNLFWLSKHDLHAVCTEIHLCKLQTSDLYVFLLYICSTLPFKLHLDFFLLVHILLIPVLLLHLILQYMYKPNNSIQVYFFLEHDYVLCCHQTLHSHFRDDMWSQPDNSLPWTSLLTSFWALPDVSVIVNLYSAATYFPAGCLADRQPSPNQCQVALLQHPSRLYTETRFSFPLLHAFPTQLLSWPAVVLLLLQTSASLFYRLIFCFISFCFLSV